MPNIKDLFEVYRPKPKDEQEFVDKHVVIKHKDANGNGDDVFNASNVKKVDRKKTRMGYDVPEDEKVYEETDLEESLGMGFKTSSEKSKFGPGHRAKLMNPEGRLSYLSQKAYKTAKHAKDAAKFYHSIGNLPTQTIDNKMRQYNKDYDVKHKMDEAFELDKDQIANSILEMAEVEGVELTKQELNHLVNKLVEAADEDTAEKTEMAQTQLHFIAYAVKEILDFVKMGGEVEEWYQNKLSKVHSDVESLHSYIEGEKRRTGMVKENADIHPKLQELIDRHPEVDRALNTGLNFQHAQDAMDHVAGHVLHKMDYNDWSQYRQPLIDHFKSYGLKEDADQIDEVLTAKTPMKTYIKDFKKSDAPQFKGKSQEKRRQMAIAAKLSAERGPQNEEVEAIEELSNKTMRSYTVKASSPKNNPPKESGGYKRDEHIAKATSKLMKKEEVELDEVSDELTQDYLQKAFASRQRLRGAGKNNPTLAKKAVTRDKYIHKALDKFGNNKVTKEDTDEQIDEVLKTSTPMKTWIKDFTKSDAPQFKGKSVEKRREMAIAAKLEAERGPQNEEVEQIDEIQKSYGQSKGPVLKTSKGTFTAFTTSHDPYRYHIIQTSDSEGNKFTKKNSPTQHLNVGNLEKVKAKFEQMKEEIELDEVFDTPKGKEVARAYIKRASTNAFSKGFTGGSMLNRQIEDPASREQEQKGGEKAVKTGLKRLVGIGRATDRLTKEEAEVPFEGPYRKPGTRKDEYGNKIKNVPRHLAKQAMKSLTKEDIINNAIDKFVPEEAKYSVDERFAMRLEDIPELHRSALTKLFNGLTEANKKVMLNQLSEEAGLQKLINFVIENRND